MLFAAFNPRFGESLSCLYRIGNVFGLTPDQETMFDRIDNSCEWEITSGEYQQLHQLGPSVPESDIVVFTFAS
jgi:hypothetical protein